MVSFFDELIPVAAFEGEINSFLDLPKGWCYLCVSWTTYSRVISVLSWDCLASFIYNCISNRFCEVFLCFSFLSADLCSNSLIEFIALLIFISFSSVYVLEFEIFMKFLDGFLTFWAIWSVCWTSFFKTTADYESLRVLRLLLFWFSVTFTLKLAILTWSVLCVFIGMFSLMLWFDC